MRGPPTRPGTIPRMLGRRDRHGVRAPTRTSNQNQGRIYLASAMVVGLAACYSPEGIGADSSDAGLAASTVGTSNSTDTGFTSHGWSGSSGGESTTQTASSVTGVVPTGSSTEVGSSDASGGTTGATSSSTTGGTNSDGTSESSTTGDSCLPADCHGAGECVDGVCVCRDDFDPATGCGECLEGRIERDGQCIIDRCATNPCNIGSGGHGAHCQTSIDGGEHECTCLGDSTPESDCQACPPGQVPSTGHSCVASTGVCKDVSCGIGASCHMDTGECVCIDPWAVMLPNGDCVNPCASDPCHIGLGTGSSCTPTSATQYQCVCKGGHTPASDCADCPAGQHTDGAVCVDDCLEPCAGAQE